MNTLPINGRIVIIDDDINQARPLMEELGKRRLPYLYYDGNPENLPISGTLNDVRLLFLDINLQGNSFRPVKELYPIIHAILQRVISPNNFPYVLVCWSRNIEDYNYIIEQLYQQMRDRSPICSISLSKADFFTMTGEKTDDYDEKIELLFTRISDEISQHISFSNLLQWENHIHAAANHALNESLSCIANDWDSTADWIFTKWGLAYAGRRFKAQNSSEKLKSAFFTLNHFMQEAMDIEISNGVPPDSRFNEDSSDREESLLHFNEKLIFSFCQTAPKEPGRIVITNAELDTYKDTLGTFLRESSTIIPIVRKEGMSDKDLRKAIDKHLSKVRERIYQQWDIFKLVINPICDFAQDKLRVNRVIPGIFIPAEFYNLIIRNSDAIYVSPKFHYTKKDKDYFFILDFRYFTSEQHDNGESSLKIKQIVLAEILSKLSRHINRQGLLFIDE